MNNFELKVNKIEYDGIYGENISNSNKVVEISKKLIGDLAQEHFLVFAVNNKSEIIGYYTAAVGGVDTCSVDLRSVFRIAIIVGAKGIICAHNHPSGVLEFSDDDIKLTEKIKSGCSVLDLVFLDHIIVSDNGYCEMPEELQGG